MAEVLASAYLEAQVKPESKKYALSTDKPCRIGRNEGNTIVLEDDLASRNHAIVQTSESGVYYLTDLGSTNGTLVNGSRVTIPVVLKPGDKIQIGNHAFVFHQEMFQVPEPEVIEQKATSLFVAMRVISVLVVDIRDFTGLGQRIGAKLGEVAGTLFREGGQVLQQHGAWAQKYIGDAVMAVWLHKGVRAEMDEFIPVFSALSGLHGVAGRLQQRFELEHPIRIGAGINTGPASIGNFGSIAASDYTALGDVVNKAFRLESATKEVGSDLVLGHETYDLISKSPDVPRLFSQNMIKLKGYNEPAKVYGAHLVMIDSLVGALRSGGTRTAC
jgi:adenylate cyclase